MIFLITYGGTRPNRITEVKDEDYHSRYARFCAFNANNTLHQEFLTKVELNKKFYTGDQWVDEEDLEEFLKDDTGEMRNRIKVVNNIIRPMVEQYRGNAIRMEYNATLKSYSKHAINRRESAYAEFMLHHDTAQKIPSLKPMLKRRFGVGDTPEESSSIFQNTYIDQYVEVMNRLLTYVAELNDFDSIKFESAIPLALNGICITKHFEYANHMRFDTVQPEYFFWDRSGKKYDLSDAGYWGETIPMEVTDVLEQNPDIDDEQQKAIEKWSTQNITNVSAANISSVHQMGTTKVPTFYVYWRDTEKIEFGYVLDEFGYPYFTKINFTYPGEEAPRYTDKDLISVEPHKQKRVLNGKLKKAIYTDLIRYCHFVPLEIIAANSDAGKHDIVLDYGILPYQEKETNDFHSAKPPYAIYTWCYLNGQVISPVDDAINPQRLINRITSVAENQINNSRGAGTVYDKSLLEDKREESEMLRAMNQSRPVGIHAKGKGIQNVIGSYDGTVKQGTQVLFNVAETFTNYVTRMTGVNDALQGQQQSNDQLVGVTQLMIQKGSLMQEPFYNALAEMMKRNYQSVATVGKNIYADNEREMAIAVGDDGTAILKISKDMKAEDFRCFVKRENVDDMLIQSANSMLMTLKQFNMIDDARFADLYNRGTPEAVSVALRQYAKEKLEMARQSAKNQQEQTDELNRKMAITNNLETARQDKNVLDNKESQATADKNKTQNIILQNQGKENVARINSQNKNSANLEK